MTSVNFTTYIQKIAKRDAKTGISGVAASQANDLANALARKLVYKACMAATQTKKETVSAKHAGHAVNVLVSDSQLRNKLLKAGKDAVSKYNSSKGGKGTKPIPASTRAGLIIAPSRVAKFFTCQRKSKLTSVYIAAVVETVLEDILKRAAKSVHDAKRSRIMSSDLAVAVRGDGALAHFVHKGLHFSVAHAKADKDIQQVKEGEKIRRKTKSKINQAQKSTNFMLRRARVARIIKAIINDKSVRLSSNASLAIQAWLEKRAVDFMRGARAIAENCGRKRVSLGDMETVRKIKDVSHSPAPKSVVDMFEVGSVGKLVKRAGVISISKEALHDLISCMAGNLVDFVRGVNDNRVLDKRTTIQLKDVQQVHGKVVSTGAKKQTRRRPKAKK